ncbi:hypothetical protein SAMN05443661_13220 [Natronobacterium gregoryi]|uniref:Uncharacterized protein n=2 Tax=Natronobacterium gregoryi TaxID=44930 RepID=L0AJG1_NATGS|nr:hypothetical protein Natgr_2802 [Natronobacterium gregoryi SP2]SFJ47060.1 hypothetical protein SAMN05443661_13220 [Natronobacterium gregoryi]
MALEGLMVDCICTYRNLSAYEYPDHYCEFDIAI